MKHSFYLYIILILLCFITPGFHCGDHNSPYSSCGSYETDTVYFPINIKNSAPVYHINDSIKFYSKISDSIYPQSGDAFRYPFNRLSANVQSYRVAASGSSYQLNYASIEFSAYLYIGLFDNTGNFENKMIFQRAEPDNTLDGGYISRDTGLYVIVLNLSNNYSPPPAEFYEGNNFCKTYNGFFSIPELKQNKQYWDSVGITTLTLANGNSAQTVNKTDKNYFFVKVVP